MDKSQELLDNWKQLNNTANKLLKKHQSFRTYNNIRLQMDRIEATLRDGYDIDVYSLTK